MVGVCWGGIRGHTVVLLGYVHECGISELIELQSGEEHTYVVHM